MHPRQESGHIAVDLFLLGLSNQLSSRKIERRRIVEDTESDGRMVEDMEVDEDGDVSHVVLTAKTTSSSTTSHDTSRLVGEEVSVRTSRCPIDGILQGSRSTVVVLGSSKDESISSLDTSTVLLDSGGKDLRGFKILIEERQITRDNDVHSISRRKSTLDSSQDASLARSFAQRSTDSDDMNHFDRERMDGMGLDCD